MKGSTDIKTIAFVGTYIPQKCGIATFTSDVRQAFCKQYSGVSSLVVPVCPKKKEFDYPAEARFEIIKDDFENYKSAADYINFQNTDIVCLQHEFGIFGGTEGSYVLGLLKNLNMPVVTTLHTILDQPNEDQKKVMHEITALSSRLVVMTEKGRSLLQSIYSTPEYKIDVIPHGIPDMPFVDPNFYKDKFGVEGQYLLLTFGLLSPNKGIEYVLRALPEIIKEVPNVTYIILGATHPNLLLEEGESYRMSLEILASELNIKKNVVFYNRFVDIDELKEFLGATDIYITPYLNPIQITSGTLAYSFGCGKAVISTPYWHAEELLAEDRGILVPFKDSRQIAKEVIKLIKKGPLRHAMRKRAYMLGRSMVWSNVVHLYYDSFIKAQTLKAKHNTAQAIKSLEKKGLILPEIRLDHINRITDATGIIQHCKYAFPRYEDGYCSDDNSRALILSVLLENIRIFEKEVFELSSKYASFINSAFNSENNRFRNFMSFDKKWLEDAGSEDSQARCLWALGTCIGSSRNKYLKNWAADLFGYAISGTEIFSSIRAWAFTLLAIYEYTRNLKGDRYVNKLGEELTEKLLGIYRKDPSDEWKWFENRLTYDNAKLSHAMLASGYRFGNKAVLDTGLESLTWLTKKLFNKDNIFSPIGNSSFYLEGKSRSEFDQQPIEAQAYVSACIQAFHATADGSWLDHARRAFDWFLGRNVLNISLYDPKTAGCMDGLHVDRANLNQGAESTLAFLLALVELKINENQLNSFNFDKPVE
ncbi:MAG: glycosyltransferase family 4 protein [Oligoflexia bacterium]|nr:glycosyltransferase family 4 protein [Oligoflexia bacterium]